MKRSLGFCDDDVHDEDDTDDDGDDDDDNDRQAADEG